MENIIKKAIEGGYKVMNFEEVLVIFQKPRMGGKNTALIMYYQNIICDPLFWQALAQTQFKGWGDVPSENFCGWLYHAQNFHRINLTQGWDKAVEYLEDLIK